MNKSHQFYIKEGEHMDKDRCEFCMVTPCINRKELMYAQTSDYKVIINSCNYLEDNVIGGTVPHSVYGIKINYCPMCGRHLE